MHTRIQLSLTACVIVLALLPAAAQTLDTGILGTVTDPQGAAIAGATVIISNAAQGISRTVKTGQDGEYEVRYLVPGEYNIEVQAPGFRSERRTGVGIQINQQARIDFAMQIGEVQQTVEITGAAPLLPTENATLGEVVSTERIVNLPLNGRSFVELSILTPGVRVAEPSQFTSSTDGSRIIANGARDSWMQVNIDGVTMVNNRSNYVTMYPIIDALQEFKVQSGNYSAEYGATPARKSTYRCAPARLSFTAACGNLCAMTSSTRAAISGPRRFPRTFCRGIGRVRPDSEGQNVLSARL